MPAPLPHTFCLIANFHAPQPPADVACTGTPIWELAMMRILNRAGASVLIGAGLLVMLSSSMVGGGLSDLLGFPLFIAGLLWLALPEFLGRRRSS